MIPINRGKPLAYSKTIIFSLEHLLFTYFKCKIQNRGADSIQGLCDFEFLKVKYNLRKKKNIKKNKLKVNSVPADQTKVKTIFLRKKNKK